jgi:hypothetical protein
MDFTISAAKWVLSKALSYAKDNVLEAWAASKNLGTETDALINQLYFAQVMLYNTHDREIDNPYLNEMLLKIRLLAYDADDVLDELDYFRIQDELDGTYHTTMPPMSTPGGVSQASSFTLATQLELSLLNSSPPPPADVTRSVLKMTSKMIPHRHHPPARMARRGMSNSCRSWVPLHAPVFVVSVSTPVCSISLPSVYDYDQSI